MMKAKTLTIKNMKETLVNYSGSEDEMTMIWDTLQKMCCMGFITNDTWVKFFDQCHGWYVTEDQSEVRDSANDDKLIWKYTSDALYIA